MKIMEIDMTSYECQKGITDGLNALSAGKGRKNPYPAGSRSAMRWQQGYIYAEAYIAPDNPKKRALWTILNA